MRTWALKRPRPKQELDQKGLGLKKEMTVRKKIIKGCITENKKAKAQIRTRLKRLWPKTIVDYKKIHQKKDPFPENKRPHYWARPMHISKIKREKIKWAELLGLAHVDG